MTAARAPAPTSICPLATATRSADGETAAATIAPNRAREPVPIAAILRPRRVRAGIAPLGCFVVRKAGPTIGTLRTVADFQADVSASVVCRMGGVKKAALGATAKTLEAETKWRIQLRHLQSPRHDCRPSVVRYRAAHPYGRVYNYMASGLALSGIVAFGLFSSAELAEPVLPGSGGRVVGRTCWAGSRSSRRSASCC